MLLIAKLPKSGRIRKFFLNIQIVVYLALERERQVSATDESIDRLVYQLYGLDDSEIAIVEGRG